MKYTISYININKLISSERHPLFLELKFLSNNKGRILFEENINDIVIEWLEKDIGIYEYKKIDEQFIYFSFTRIEGDYYNIIFHPKKEWKDNPFQFRTFDLSNIVYSKEERPFLKMYKCSKWIHIQTIKGSDFLFTIHQNENYCCICQRLQKNVLGIRDMMNENDQIYICKNCRINI
jgi:hypothetical protein